MIALTQQLLGALAFAGLFGLIAIGVSLIFGMTGIINFAQGDLLMVGSYVALAVADGTGSLALGVVAGALAVGLLGVLIYLGLFDRVKDQPIAGFIVSIGLISILENGMQEIAGPQEQQLPTSLGEFRWGSFVFLQSDLIILVVCVAVLTGLLLAYYRTPFGRIVRACVEDKETASLMGINVRRVNTAVLGVSAALAGLGGGLYLMSYSITPFFGSQLVVNGFLAALLGGLRRIEGAVVGAFAIGLVQGLNAQYGPSAWTPVLVYGLMITILLARPGGLLAER